MSTKIFRKATIKDEPGKLLIFENGVYDIEKWIPKHPGGKLISWYVSNGEDSTDAITAFHPEVDKIKAIMKKYYVGELIAEDVRPSALVQDFRNLRAEFVKEGLFKANYWFSFAHLIQIIFLEILAVLIISSAPESKLAFFLCAFVL